MSKRESCTAKVAERLDAPVELERLMLRESALPGRRANLELAAAFADVVAIEGSAPRPWPLVVRWSALSAIEAPTNDPREFLPFVAAQAAGAHYASANSARRRQIADLLRAAANDDRWRVREAAAFGLQRVGERDFAALQGIFESWADDATPLELRAELAALAHPPLLVSVDRVRFALSVADVAMEWVRDRGDAGRAEPQATALVKGLGFAPSVYAAAAPEEGFSWLERWGSCELLYIKKIVAANLRKARLARAFPDRVSEVGEALQDF